jgi:hypothetical protein
LLGEAKRCNNEPLKGLVEGAEFSALIWLRLCRDRTKLDF